MSPSARLSTGANIVSGEAYARIDAEMVDMETFAVVRAASLFSVPVIGLRGISDGKAELNHIDDWTEYLHIIDEKLAAKRWIGSRRRLHPARLWLNRSP
jgi:adenosylhomocysteine nucleosidase